MSVYAQLLNAFRSRHIGHWLYISIPKRNEVEHKVRFLLSENGYHGSVSTRAFYSDKNHFSDELVNEYCNYGFLPTLFKGDRGSRIRLMIIDIVFWAETRSDEPVYVLVISKDIKT